MTDLPVATSSRSSEPPEDPTPEPSNGKLGFWQRWGEMLMAAGVLVVAAVVLIGAQDIEVRRGVVVSPRIIPQMVGIGLLLCGIWYAIDIIRSPSLELRGGEDDEDVDPDATTDWAVLGLIAIALVAYAALIDTAGFVIASAALFIMSAFAMGSRRTARDILVGIALAIGVYLLFDGWLGVRLPEGWLVDIF